MVDDPELSMRIKRGARLAGIQQHGSIDPGMANCPIAVVHSTGRRQWTPAFLMARYNSLSAASSVGKLPRVLMILRSERCSASTALVV